MYRVLWITVAFIASDYYQGANSCCIPLQWESLNFYRQVADVNGTKTDVQGEEMVSVDGTGQLLNSMASYTSSGQTTSVRTIQDFKGGKQYVIIGANCNVTMLGPWTPKCIPDNVTAISTGSLGLGDKAIMIDVYSVPVGQQTVIMDMARPDCIPVAIAAYGVNSMAAKFYTNFTLGIKDRSVFDIPSICQKSLHLDHHQPHGSDIHGLFW